MKICVSGWYFYQPLLDSIVESGFPCVIVGHRRRDVTGIPIITTPEGRGLDVGCYQQYLMEHWDGESDVLFMQDDGNYIPFQDFHEIANLALKTEIDQAYIFRDEYEEHFNQGQTTRAFWCRGSWLREFKASGGFDVDWSNTGNTEGRQANYGVVMLARKMKDNPRCGWIAIVPGVQMARRGYIADKCYQYKRVEGQHGIVTPEGMK